MQPEQYTHVQTPEQRNAGQLSLFSNILQYLVPLFSVVSILRRLRNKSPSWVLSPLTFFFSLEAEVIKRLLLTLFFLIARVYAPFLSQCIYLQRGRRISNIYKSFVKILSLLKFYLFFCFSKNYRKYPLEFQQHKGDQTGYLPVPTISALSETIKVQEHSIQRNSITTLENILEVSLRSKHTWASLVAQWLRICLLMQGTRVRALVWEDPTCRGAAGPVSHSY